MRRAFIPIEPGYVINDAATACLAVLQMIDQQIASGHRTPADAERDISLWEQRLAGQGGVPRASLMQDGVDNV